MSTQNTKKSFSIERKIEIDTAHRVPLHESQCRNIHGHRYSILAEATGPLVTEGSQSGMVIDFGFLKQIMMETAYDLMDHGMILWDMDPLNEQIYNRESDDNNIRSLVSIFNGLGRKLGATSHRQLVTTLSDTLENMDPNDSNLFYKTELNTSGSMQLRGYSYKVLAVPFFPTAENIARFLYLLFNVRLGLMVTVERPELKDVEITKVTIFETPNGKAVYPA